MNSNYYPLWQNNRINFILNRFKKEFFVGKKILELGSCNGYIGEYIRLLGADVLSVEGRQSNVNNIKETYPELKVQLADLDVSKWNFDDYDIIINFGLFYHLEKHHKNHLINCINHCKLMFFESVIYDSNDDELFYRYEIGMDQSLSTISGTPSTSFVENIFKETDCNFIKFCDPSLNDGNHYYDWIDKHSKIYDTYARRFWIVNK